MSIKSDMKEFKLFAVNTELKEASQNGKNIILRGGNAIDAAITAALTIGVVNSFSSGIGGGGFLLYMNNDENSPKYDMFGFRETAPENVNVKYLEENENSRMKTGHSIAVPGEILGFYKAHKKYGKLPWKDLFTDVIPLAKKFPVSKILISKIKKNYDDILNDEGLRQTFLINNKIPREGEIISRENLANTLSIISNDPMDFYKGKIANRIVEFLHNKDSPLSLKDLNNYRVKKRPVIIGSFYDYQVITTGLPTSGIFIIEGLNILERLNIRDMKYLINGKNSYYMYHLMFEVMKFVTSSKQNFGDPDFMKDWRRKLMYLLSDDNARKISRQFKMNKTQRSRDYGFKKQIAEDNGTTHLNVVDKEGNIVSLTSTINMEFGSKIMDPETGIIFNNHINDFYFPEYKNIKTPNILEKGKRPQSSISPIILKRKNEVVVVGGSGGSRITNSLILFIGYLMAGNTVNDSVSLCRVHAQMNTNQILIEPSLNESIIHDLKSLGHNIKSSSVNTTYSTLQALQIATKDDDKIIYAISDTRKNGTSDGI